jgi:hypothetical protein
MHTTCRRHMSFGSLAPNLDADLWPMTANPAAAGIADPNLTICRIYIAVLRAIYG